MVGAGGKDVVAVQALAPVDASALCDPAGKLPEAVQDAISRDGGDQVQAGGCFRRYADRAYEIGDGSVRARWLLRMPWIVGVAMEIYF